MATDPFSEGREEILIAGEESDSPAAIAQDLVEFAHAQNALSSALNEVRQKHESVLRTFNHMAPLRASISEGIRATEVISGRFSALKGQLRGLSTGLNMLGAPVGLNTSIASQVEGFIRTSPLITGGDNVALQPFAGFADTTLKTIGDPKIRTRLPELQSFGLMHTSLRDAVEPLMGAASEVQAAIRSLFSQQPILQEFQNQLTATSVIQRLDQAREVLSAIDSQSLAGSLPRFDEILQTVSEEIESLSRVSHFDHVEGHEGDSSPIEDPPVGLEVSPAEPQSTSPWVKAGVIIDALMLLVMVLTFHQQLAGEGGHASEPKELGNPNRTEWSEVDSFWLYLIEQASFLSEEQRIIRNAPVRLSPQGKAPQLCRLDAGDSVRIIGVSGAWYQVALRTSHSRDTIQTGWIFKNHLAKP